MKKIFSIFLVCCASIACADDNKGPVFEEVDAIQPKANIYVPFACKDPVFEEENEAEADEEFDNPCARIAMSTCEECGDECECEECECEEECALTCLCDCKNGKCKDGKCKLANDQEESSELVFTKNSRAENGKPVFEETDENSSRFAASCCSWHNFKSNFGMEKLYIRFPAKPAVSYTGDLATAFAYDYDVMYSLCGYYPPIGNIDPLFWFEEVLAWVDSYPYELISRTVYQVSNGDWVMDYITHDFVKDIIIKARAIVTPFNAYTIQCVKPYYARDYFDYFLDSFYLQCDCY